MTKRSKYDLHETRFGAYLSTQPDGRFAVTAETSTVIITSVLLADVPLMFHAATLYA